MNTSFKYLSVIFFMQMSFAQAQEFSTWAQSKKYQECIGAVAADNIAAVTTAREWYLGGGGVAAQHCEALALYEQERYGEAAELFETVVGKLSRDEGINDFANQNEKILKVQLNYMAGISWHSANEFDKAYNALSAAIIDLEDKSKYAYDLFIKRGLVQISTEKYENAAQDFSQALEINSAKADAFLFRAESYRQLNEHLKARLDLNAALSLEPDNPDVLFESGVNYRMQHNDEKALVEWERLVQKYPDTYWQKLVEDNIRLIGK